jgi:VWFA-related protein
MTRTTAALTTTATLIVCSFSLVSSQQRDPQIPTFRSGVELVTVDVGVVDRQGRPVAGLTSNDFTVNVAGQPRRVVSAEFVNVAAARTETSAEPGLVPISSNEGAGIGRLFVFVVDQSTLEPGNVRHIARAAAPFLTNLGFVDRSALMLLPAGPNINFTWAHERVRDALQRVIGQNGTEGSWEFGSLTEARDIANRNLIALRTVSQRECGSSASASALDTFGLSGGGTGGGGSPAPAPSGGTASGGQTGGSGSGGGGTAGGSGGSGQTSGGSGGSSSSRSGGGFGASSCMRDVQMRAEWAWRGAQMTSLASVSSLRQLLAALARVQGDKTIILISGGWPLDDREQHTLMSTLASEAATARATMFTLFVPNTMSSASRRTISSTPANDQYLHAWPLETLASMTGGGSFRAEVGADSVFERLGRELSGYYRLGVEKDPSDADGKGRRLKVQVSRSSVTVRAREIFDARTYEDRDWAARLASALEAPIPATGVGLRVTSYVTADPEDSARVKLVLTGEASRLDPGDAKVQVLVRDLQGTKVLAGEHPLGQPKGDGLTFSTNIPLAPGTYVIRIAVIDGNGRVGSVDHRTEARPQVLGSLAASGPLLVRVPRLSTSEPTITLDKVGQDERLALQVDLDGDSGRLTNAEVTFDIASSADGPALVNTAATMSPGRRGAMVAHGVADLRVLPPGTYIARARVKSGTESLGEVRRAFIVTEAAMLPASAVAVAGDPKSSAVPVPARMAGRSAVSSAATLPKFAVDDTLTAPVLGAFLDRIAARSDASSPMIKDLLQNARTGDLGQLYISDVLAAEYPVAGFLKGLSLLSQKKLDLAMKAFRSTMRASADFYPAMVYIGVCYAADGNDKEASGAWRTALIKEADTLPVHLLLADALLRQDNGELALQTLDSARSRWPADDGLKRRFVLAALMAGEYADGLLALDELVDKHAEDEPALAAGLMVLYEAFRTSRPIEDIEKDRTRIFKLAEAYRARGGPLIALVDTWLLAAKEKQ